MEIKKVKESAYLFLGSMGLAFMGLAFGSRALGVGDKLALRFPRFLSISYDKGHYDITIVKEIRNLKEVIGI